MTSLARVRRRIRPAMVALLLLIGLAGSGTAQALVPLRFVVDWRFEGPSAPFLLALERGYFRQEGLDVTLDSGNGSRQVVPQIAAGMFDAGFADINTLVRFRDENPGLDLKAVMMLHDRSPFAIVGRRSRGITGDIRSIEGKKLAAPAADGAFAQWPAFKALNRLDDSKMRLENVGFLVREPMLASGEVDAVFGYAATSAINLKARGVPVGDIVVMLMADHGLELYGSAVMISPKFLAEQPEAVRGLLRAIMRGVRDAVTQPGPAIQAVLARNQMARAETERERLQVVIEQSVLTPWVKENGLGGIDQARWERALDQLEAGQVFRDRSRAGNAFTDAFLPPAAERRF